MKVKCINNDDWKYLIIDKIYDVIEEDDEDDEYQMINDKGYIWGCSKYRFKLLSEIRNEKIDKLLEDEN